MATDDLADYRILVTGGAGFIGSHVVEELLDLRASVRVLDNFETGRRENLEHIADRIELMEGDICDLSTCERAMCGIDMVSHQAALGSVTRSLTEPAKFIRTNVTGTTNIFQAARDAGVRRVVYASSCSVYGGHAPSPNREGYETPAATPYALSKAMAEQIAGQFFACYAMELVGLRYFNVYGPRQDPTGPYAAVVPQYFLACFNGRPPIIHGNGEQTRDFVYVKDIAQANARVLRQACATPGTYNVGTGIATSIEQLALLVSSVTEYTGGCVNRPDTAAGDARSVADPSRFARTFGYQPATSLEEGLRRSTQHYRKLVRDDYAATTDAVIV